MPRPFPVYSEWFAGSPSHASRCTSAASSAPLPLGCTTTPASATFSPPVRPPLSTARQLWSFLHSVRLLVATFLSRVTRSSSASPSVCHLVAVPVSPNHALQRTPGFGVQLPGAALIRPAQSRAVLPEARHRPRLRLAPLAHGTGSRTGVR